MKKLLVFGLCVLGFILIAAPTAVEYYPVFLNGKPFGKAALINGIIAISVEDFAKAAGGTLTLEQAGFQLQGNTLNAMVSGYSAEHKHKMDTQAKIKIDQASAVGYKENAQLKIENKAAIKIEGRQLFKVNKAGQISTRLLNGDGKAWIPLADVAKAFGGGVWVAPTNLKPGEAIQLNFTQNTNAILIGL